MRLLALVVLAPVLLAGNVAQQSKEQPLTNSDIVRMVTAGLGDQVILKKIEASNAQFSVSSEDLTALKAAGVSDAVLLAMLDKARQPQSPAKAEDVSPSKAATPSRSQMPRDLDVVAVWLQEVNSNKSHEGEEIWLEVYKVLYSSKADLFIVPIGTRIKGRVTKAIVSQRGFLGGKLGAVHYRLEALILPDGREAALDFPRSITRGWWDFKSERMTDKPKNRVAVRSGQTIATLGTGAGAGTGLALGATSIVRASGAAGLAVVVLPIFKAPAHVIPSGVGQVVRLNPSNCEDLLEQLDTEDFIRMGFRPVTTCRMEIPQRP